MERIYQRTVQQECVQSGSIVRRLSWSPVTDLSCLQGP